METMKDNTPQVIEAIKRLLPPAKEWSNPQVLVWDDPKEPPQPQEGVSLRVTLELTGPQAGKLSIDAADVTQKVQGCPWIAWYRVQIEGEVRDVVGYHLKPLGKHAEKWFQEEAVGRLCEECFSLYLPVRENQRFCTTACGRKYRSRESKRKSRRQKSG